MDDLVALAARGGQEGRNAFEQLYLRCWGDIVGTAYGKVRDSSTAEDAAQQTFLQAIKQMSSLRQLNMRGFTAFLLTILNNLLADAARRDGRFRRALNEGGLAKNVEAGSQDSAPLLDSGRVQQAIRSLPPAHEQALRLFYEEGLACREIALRLTKSEGAVRNLLHRARNELRAALRQCGIENLEDAVRDPTVNDVRADE